MANARMPEEFFDTVARHLPPEQPVGPKGGRCTHFELLSGREGVAETGHGERARRPGLGPWGEGPIWRRGRRASTICARRSRRARSPRASKAQARAASRSSASGGATKSMLRGCLRTAFAAMGPRVHFGAGPGAFAAAAAPTRR